MKSKKIFFTLMISILLILVLTFTNLYFSPDSLWFIYPVAGIIWMALTIILAKRNSAIKIAISGAVMISLAAVCVNLKFTPEYHWFFEAIFLALWWPLGVYIARHPHSKVLSILGSLLIIAMLVIENLIHSPKYLWFVYAVFPILWWPIIKLFPKLAASKAFAVISSLIIISYYAALNMFCAPGYPWFIYPAFAVLWWPLANRLGGKGKGFSFSLAGSGLIILFFIIVNLVSSPNAVWAIYPIFAVLWWPLAYGLGRKGKGFALSLAGSGLTIIFFVMVNYITSPRAIWAIYPIFAVLWWPLGVYFHKKIKRVNSSKKEVN